MSPIESPQKEDRYPVTKSHLSLESSLEELFLYDFQVEISCLGKNVACTLDSNHTLPGVVITEQGEFVGMISRRRFLERMSQPYSLELFLKRPLKSLYNFVKVECLILPTNTLIVTAAKKSLQRSPEFLYEPIVVKSGNKYRLLDAHQLLVAQSKIHELTANLLDEKNYAHRVQTEKMATLGKMVAGVAHEIRNPVNSVHGNFDFLVTYHENIIDLLRLYQQELKNKSQEIEDFEEELELEFILEDSPQLINSMKNATKKLFQIVTSLRNFSRIDNSSKQIIDINECLDGTLLILNSQLKNYKIAINKKYRCRSEFIGYSGQLSQVFTNIIANGIDALTEKQEKYARQQKKWQAQIVITTDVVNDEQNEPWIEIKIRDNALGIAPEIQTRIFEDFFTTKPAGKGTGLGLAISWEIITKKHQGKLNFNSQLDVGTEFEILLPLSSD